MSPNELVSEQLRRLPTNPGVYLMKDTEGKVIYVGKAISLRNRVRSYFGSSDKLTPKLQALVSQINNLEFVITSSEQEALILEMNLIKRYRPHFNVRMKDDKSFPYLKIDMREDWPRIYLTRRLENDGGYYFGPFASAWSVRQTLRIIREIFPFRSCTKPITGKDTRPCLEYHIGRCLGPCIGAVTPREHKKMLKQVIEFLRGKEEKTIRELEKRMNEASEALLFEKAALYRDRLEAIRRVVEGQRIAAKVRGDQDAIAIAPDHDQACAEVFIVRGGRLMGRESFVLQGTETETPQQIMTVFVQEFYNKAPYVPPLILLQHPVEYLDTITAWLENKRGGRVRIVVPRRGDKKQLVDTVAENARQKVEQLKIKEMVNADGLAEALREIVRELQLPHTPMRMEGYDISNIQGRMAVGSMVVFEKGKPKPAHYRRFKIKTVDGANDYAMIQEVLRRRFKHVNGSGDRWPDPDLILIDGGKGQLNAAREALKEVHADGFPAIGLAKENEEIYLPERSKPLVLPHRSHGLQMLQRLRDEAHRFAIGYHRKLHKKESFTSALDSIPGIGANRKRALLKKYGTVQAVRDASVDELAAVDGMNKGIAAKIKERL